MSLMRWLDRIIGSVFRSIYFGCTLVLATLLFMIAGVWLYNIVSAPQHIAFPFITLQLLFTSSIDGTFEMSITGNFLAALLYPTILFAPIWLAVEWYMHRLRL
ncbi:MAG: hypothetical protein GFH27_549287n154 [Chloroflexi bacterium AL-W]|nr:hypothetical protein [Chloroflexi bacterium AL-N1]NOK66428.1 hypothetical protein [Chloroflexi bacterium AL-N10]NOK71816.1 hypothetical protein [Chloroflexi bacterium AL-N5]NOK81073.1 hypothetical protein [Chloroflexi bacterium AL-W]NOK89346.1 hypothetical protein [Chloroflexi bacterium AL-N15]